MGVLDRFGRKATPMGDHNGKPLAFPAAANIPIVGLPFELEVWFIQVLITCKCEAPKPVLIIGQPPAAMGQCPSCKKTYQLQTIGIDPRTGQPHFQIAMVIPPSADDTKT
jgi:hypothetical protein